MKMFKNIHRGFLNILVILSIFFLSGCSDICENITIEVKSNINGMSTSLHIVICYDEETYKILSKLKSEQYFKKCSDIYSEHCESIDIFNVEPYKNHKSLKYKLTGRKLKKTYGVLVFPKYINVDPVKIRSIQYKNSLIILYDQHIKVLPIQDIEGSKKIRKPIKHNDILYDNYQKESVIFKKILKKRTQEVKQTILDKKDQYKNQVKQKRSIVKNKFDDAVQEGIDFIKTEI